jgi:hypothetical protein
MKIFKIGPLALALACVTPTPAMAQSTDAQAWSGLFVQAKAGYASFTPSLGGGSLSFPNSPFGPLAGSYSSSASNLNTPTAAVDLGYNFAVDSDKLIGIGLTYYTGATGSASAMLNPLVTTYGLGTAPQVSLNYQIKNLWAITIQPGWALDKERLVYAKVGYTGTTLGASGSSNASTLGYGGAGSSIPYQTVTLSGYALGLGYKQTFTSSLYWLVEANYGSFSTKTATVNISNNTVGAGTGTGTFGGSGVDFLIGIGYRF